MGGVKFEKITYDRVNDKIWIETPSLYEFIDLGLPSGIEWASYNVGATKPEELGLYFAWGETQGYTVNDVINNIKPFYWTDYKFSIDGTVNFSKYNKSDGLITLEKIDDAAIQSDKKYRIPTKNDWEELINNTVITAVENYNGSGVNGALLTSNNGKTLFLPLCGIAENGTMELTDTHCYYWSSTLNTSYYYRSWYFGFNFNTLNYLMVNSDRYNGLQIRPIKI